MCANFTDDTYFDLEHVRQFPSDKILLTEIFVFFNFYVKIE